MDNFPPPSNPFQQPQFPQNPVPPNQVPQNPILQNPIYQNPYQNGQTPIPNMPEKKSGLLKVLLIIAILIILIAGGIAFAYYKKMGPFSISAYTEENFFSSLLNKFSTIDSMAYSVKTSFGINPRESDARPFTIQISNSGKLREQYQNDAERATNLSNILAILRRGTYPDSLKKILSEKNIRYPDLSLITDPVTEREYDYKLTESGKNFALKVRFETSEAVSSIKKGYGYSSTTTLIRGNEVTFTKDSPIYFYVPSEAPKPFFVVMQENIRKLPSDLNVDLTVGASSEFKSESSEWAFNISAQGDFGDLTYKVNADALKKNDDYYFRINNIPSVFMSSFSFLKGKWIKVSNETDDSGSSAYSMLGSFSKELPEFEKSYKENREKVFSFLKEVILIADSEKVIKFKKAPRYEKVDGRQLTRYDVSIRKESILPFYQKVINLAKDAEFNNENTWLADQGSLEYLQSTQFSEVFDYFDKNITFSFWTDAEGYPAIIQMDMRIVPPDTATQLADKQANLIIKAVLSDINKPVNIEAPTDAKPIEEVMKEVQKNLYGYDVSGLENIKTQLSSIGYNAEIAYKKYNGYGKKAFSLGPCKQTASTLFAEKGIFDAIKNATDDKPSTATCASSATSGTVTSYAVSVPLPDSPGYSWCADSKGIRKQISGALKKSSCN